jgi:hypothetical protein
MVRLGNPRGSAQRAGVHQDDHTAPRPDGQVERSDRRPGPTQPASYAPAVPRLCRRLPAVPVERREAVRLQGEPWRGRLVDLER